MKLIHTILLACTFSGAWRLASAQSNPPPLTHPGKRVALALQGGSAYGFIHLGALEWLEEHRIPIDGIAGTSGGALSGGWYATGLDFLTDDQILHPIPHHGPEDLQLNGVRQVLENTNIDNLFQVSPSYGASPLARKLERRFQPSEVFMGIVNGGLRLPDGLLPAPEVGMLFDGFSLAYPTWYLYPNDAPFDKLPTPFRCVATDASKPDLRDWQPVVLGGRNMLPRAPGYEMSLSRAIRSSTCIPGAFAPVYVPPLQRPGARADYALVDGGVFDVYPTDVADDEFQPDIMLGLHFALGESPANTFLRLTGRPTLPKDYRASSVANKKGLVWTQSTHVQVELARDKFTSDEFSKWRELAWLGYRSMEEAYQRGDLAPLMTAQLEPADYLAFRRLRRQRRSGISTLITDVAAPGGLPVDGVRNVAVGKDLADPLVLRDLRQALIANLYEGNLGSILFDLRQGGVLHLAPEVRSYGPPFVHSGIDLDFGSRDRSWTQFTAHAIAPEGYGSKWWFDGSIGNDYRAAGGLEFSPRKGRLFVGPMASYTDTVHFDFADKTRLSSIRLKEAKGGLSVGYRPGRNSEIRLSGYAARLDTGSALGAPLSLAAGDYRALALHGELDSTDSPIVPTHGFRVAVDGTRSFSYPGATSPLYQAQASLNAYWPVNHSGSSLFLRARGGTSFGATVPFSAQFTVGGFGVMDAYVRDEVRDSGYVYGSVGGLVKMSSLPDYLGSTYVGGWFETSRLQNRQFSSGTIGAVVDTRLGPVFAGVALGDGGRWRLLFQLGHLFR